MDSALAGAVRVLGDAVPDWQPPPTPMVEYMGDTVQRLSLAPGDVLVLQTSGRMSEERVAHIRGCMAQVCPGHECIILADGIKLGVLAPTRASAIEDKLDALIASLVDESEDPVEGDLDGEHVLHQRDPNQSL